MLNIFAGYIGYNAAGAKTPQTESARLPLDCAESLSNLAQVIRCMHHNRHCAADLVFAVPTVETFHQRADSLVRVFESSLNARPLLRRDLLYSAPDFPP